MNDPTPPYVPGRTMTALKVGVRHVLHVFGESIYKARYPTATLTGLGVAFVGGFGLILYVLIEYVAVDVEARAWSATLAGVLTAATIGLVTGVMAGAGAGSMTAIWIGVGLLTGAMNAVLFMILLAIPGLSGAPDVALAAGFGLIVVLAGVGAGFMAGAGAGVAVGERIAGFRRPRAHHASVSRGTSLPDTRHHKSPPALARRLILLLAPRSGVLPLLGDLEEEFTRILRERGPRASRIWYWRQAIASLPPVSKWRLARSPLLAWVTDRLGRWFGNR